MNRTEIDVIERNVTVRDVLDFHGVKPKGARCICPIHKGHKYSFSFNDKLFNCFSCGEHGGVIQLEAKLSNITEAEACKVLVQRFGLNVPIQPLTAEYRDNLILEHKVEESYKEYEQEKHDYYKRMTNLFRNIREVPELYDMAKDLRDWLDENIEGVTQPWIFRTTQEKNL